MGRVFHLKTRKMDISYGKRRMTLPVSSVSVEKRRGAISAPVWMVDFHTVANSDVLEIFDSSRKVTIDLEILRPKAHGLKKNCRLVLRDVVFDRVDMHVSAGIASVEAVARVGHIEKKPKIWSIS